MSYDPKDHIIDNGRISSAYMLAGVAFLVLFIAGADFSSGSLSAAASASDSRSIVLDQPAPYRRLPSDETYD